MEPASILRFNLVAPEDDPARMASRYQAMLEMAAYADEHGVLAVNVEEHHTPDDNWSPAPLVTAGLLAARTTRLQILVSAFLAPLYDPVRVAKELAVLDLASGGRVHAVAGVGYRREEYDLFGAEWDRRGAIMDEHIATILAAWRGEEVERGGRRVRITPRPVSPAAGLLMIGGASRAAARRAARHGLVLLMNSHQPDIVSYYEERCAAYGTPPMAQMPGESSGVLLLSEDPDRAWARIGRHLLYEASRYAEWNRHMTALPPNYSRATTVEDLRAEGVYRILTPQAAAAEHRRDGGSLTLHPMCGGVPPEDAWETVRLLVEQLLPLLKID